MYDIDCLHRHLQHSPVTLRAKSLWLRRKIVRRILRSYVRLTARKVSCRKPLVRSKIPKDDAHLRLGLEAVNAASLEDSMPETPCCVSRSDLFELSGCFFKSIAVECEDPQWSPRGLKKVKNEGRFAGTRRRHYCNFSKPSNSSLVSLGDTVFFSRSHFTNGHRKSEIGVVVDIWEDLYVPSSPEVPQFARVEVSSFPTESSSLIIHEFVRVPLDCILGPVHVE
mmetsp:Transcript_5026/g.8636  ORF Transcript_5026/g.8636 Transcript_5026/m.8636 type:complete len:224 (-) Transcript_5026:604-1275(-)